ncbi:helix-turn-helix domain-containing protein [Mycolicibacterium sp. 018/SC-01/001]|uniref:helix-turn-helix domain-containing protein n=1 Tax=Mycolicibacterium sp. 018/SC-01/001 TaxID=2592069 RepID=UPI00163DA488|nr:helix-turn-helix transcriptional regulator [Mycolicibacterium sp. 018/SC-01/001]
MPTRPSQDDPKRVVAWKQRRALMGMRIQELRLQLGLTQEQLAAQSGVSRNVLMDIEHGRRAILSDRIFDIAAALGITASALLDGIE